LRRFTTPARAARSLIAAACLLCVGAPAVADDAGDLARAIQLFEDGDYLAAQEVLLEIDPQALDNARRARRDEYLNRVQVALALVEKAANDLEDASQAMQRGQLDEAETLLRQVLENEYASEELRRDAAEQQRRLAELRATRPAEVKITPATRSTPTHPTRTAETVQATPPARPPVQAPPARVQMVPAAAVQTGPAHSVSSVQTAAATPAHQHVQVTSAQHYVQAAPTGDRQASERARAFTEQGFDMLSGGRYAEAERLFQQALAAVPGYPEAAQGLEEIKAHRSVEAGPTSLVNEIKREQLIRWQRTVAMYRDAERQVRDLIVQDQYDEARQVLLRARQVIEAGRQFADPLTRYESLLSEWQALSNYVEDEQRRHNANEIAIQRAEVAREQRERRALINQNKQRQIDALMNQAFQLRKDRNYEGAIDALKQVVAIDPRNEQARWMIETLEDVYSYSRQRKYRDDLGRKTRDMFSEVEEAKVPHHDLAPSYPEYWLDIINSPNRAPAGREQLTAQDLAVHEQLDDPVKVSFEDQPFEEVVDELARGQRIDILVIWRDLESWGIDRDFPVTLERRTEVSFKKVLTDLLERVGGSDVELGFVVSEGGIEIATKEYLDRKVVSRVYDVGDLLMRVRDFTDAPKIDLTRSSSSGGGGGGGGQDENIFSDDDDDDDEDGEQEREERAQDLIDLIQNSVEPESWRDFGGLDAHIEAWDTQLVVVQTPSAHEEIADLLGMLRAQQTIQVAIESRFLTVQSNFLEELGLDLDVVLNSGNAAFDFIPSEIQGGGSVTDPVTGARVLLPRSFSQIGFMPAVPNVGNPLAQGIPGQQGAQAPQQSFYQPYGFVGTVPGQTTGMTSVPMVSSILQITDPQTLNSDLPGSFAGSGLAPALNVFGSFLDNIQVDFLLRATQADSRSSILTAPRVVLMNGQLAWVAVVNQQAYVSELQPQVASGAAAQRPQVSRLTTGAVLEVRATVSADRRYVKMQLEPRVGRLLDLSTFLFTTGPNVGVGASGFVQLPAINTQKVRTTVSVPDGGTLLVGGQKLAGEIEVEAGVPVLSKIPVLKRLYSSRTLVKDEQVLLILVKPQIIIQEESERRAFPALSSR